jgi:hypothetical protein
VHGDVLVVIVRRDEREDVRETQLQAHQHRHDQRNQPDRDRDHSILDRDHLVILAPDVFPDEGLRIVQSMLMIAICQGDE